MADNNVTLQPLTDSLDDKALIANLFNQPSTWRYWFMPPFENQKSVDDYMDDQINNSKNLCMTINATESGMANRQTAVGIVAVVDIDPIARFGEIEISLLDKYNGHGYAQSSFAQMIDLMFLNFNMHKLFLYVDVDNKPALHIYKKLGFEIEGTIKDQYYAMGSYHDAYYMGLTRKNYDK